MTYQHSFVAYPISRGTISQHRLCAAWPFDRICHADDMPQRVFFCDAVTYREYQDPISPWRGPAASRRRVAACANNARKADAAANLDDIR